MVPPVIGRAMRLGAAACFGVVLGGCVSAPRDGALLTVPFREQRAGYCGVVALAMVADYYGAALPEEALAHAYVPALGGTIPDLLAEAAGSARLKARVRRGTMDEIQDWLERGIPAIVLLDGERRRAPGHFVVLTGMSRDGRWVRTHSGERPNQWAKARLFERQWREAGSLAVLIERRSGE